mmetsp:Transcript_48096/g.155558  ORF Transcript_48096/g.155558 Transcript_48096/m.155558 type:complete len:275 (+) Transcript_48096:419-1243(+)
MSAIAFCSAAASSSGEPPAAALASSRGKEEEGGSHSHGNRCGAASGTPWTAEKSHSSASTSRGPGRLNIASPSTSTTRPSRTARSERHHSVLARAVASRRVMSRVSPHGARMTRSGSASTTAEGGTGNDFPPPLSPPALRGCSPPARSISCGVQCPPTYSGSDHSMKATRGLLLPSPSCRRRCSTRRSTAAIRSTSDACAALASSAMPTASPSCSTLASTSSRLSGLSDTTFGRGVILAASRSTVCRSMAHTEQMSCVRMTSGDSDSISGASSV